jgi:hypothetical protein
METTTFPRNGGHVSVIVCKNGKTFIVSNKTYKTKKGAESANKKVSDFCGPGYSSNNMPYKQTADDGTVTELYHTENRSNPS